MSSPDSPEEQQQAVEAAAEQAEEQAAPPDAPEPEPAEQDAPDELRQPLLDALKRELGDAVLGSEIAGGDIWVRVDRSAWRRAGEVCKSVLGMEYFCFLSGIDWMPNADLSGEKLWDPDAERGNGEGGSGDSSTTYETGAGGGDSRFQVFARVYNTSTHVGVTLKADLDDADPRVDSWTSVYRGADWHERETWEMYGFEFFGHPGLRHIYLPTDFEGHPLRKDFPLLAREVKPWPGLVDKEPIPGEEEDEAPAAEGEAGG